MRALPWCGTSPKTVSEPAAAGRRPRTISSNVVLPEPLGPITPTMAPEGTENVPSDQMGVPPRAALTPSSRERVAHVRSAFARPRS